MAKYASDYRIPASDEEEKPQKMGRTRRPIPTLEGQDIESLEKKAQERLADFLKDFDEDALTRGDSDQIRNRAYMSVVAEENNKKIMAATAGLLKLTPNEFQALQKSVTELSKEVRLLDESLGIDRKTRLASETSEMEQYLPQLHREAQKLIYERGLYLVCLECRRSEPQTEIVHGLLLYHFRDEKNYKDGNGEEHLHRWGFQGLCFRCGKEISITYHNWKEYVPSAIDEIEPPEEADDTKDEEGD